MTALIEQHLDAIRAACRRHGVARLEIFGSAADSAAFDPERSDADFIVAFQKGASLGPWLASYFNLRDDLQLALGRPVDLVMQGAMQNPHFLRHANRTRQVIYASPDAQAA